MLDKCYLKFKIKNKNQKEVKMHFSITAIIIKLFFTFAAYIIYFISDIKISRRINHSWQYYEDKNDPMANKLLKILYWLIVIFILQL